MTQLPLSILAGFLFRVLQVLIESSLYLLIGFLTVGALRVLVGAERVRKLFGSGRLTAPLWAWLAATVLLPVCSLGILPVLRELRRSGVPRHAALTFALAAPMLNPISLISGLSYLGPNLLASIMLGTFVVSVGAGVILGPSREDSGAPADDLVPGPGARKLTASLILSARTATGPAWGDIAAGLIGAGFVAAVITPSFLADSLFSGDPMAIPRMAAVAPLTYATPDKGITTIPEMLKFRQSPGAMFVLVALGVGMTLGHVRWSIRSYGIKAASAWLGTVLALTMVVAYAFDLTTPRVGTANADNDHFNEFANSFMESDGLKYVSLSVTHYIQQVEPLRWATCAALAAFMAGGWVLGRLGSKGDYGTYLTRRSFDLPPTIEPIWNRPLSPRVVSAAGSLGAVAIATVGLYAFYPAPSETFRDIGIIKADFFGELGGRSLDPAKHHLELWERQVAKLRLGSMIRLGPSDGEAFRRTEELQEALRGLRTFVESDRRDEARAYTFKVGKIQDDCRRAYRIP